MVERVVANVVFIALGAIFIFGREALSEYWDRIDQVKEKHRGKSRPVSFVVGCLMILVGVLDLVLAALGRPGLFGPG